MKRHICQSKTKSGNQCKGNAMGNTYFCYVHQDSKDSVIKDPLKESVREIEDSIISLIEYHLRTGRDISRYFGKYTPQIRNTDVL